MCLSPPPRIDFDGDISDGTDEIVGLKYLHERSRPIFTLVLAIANTIFMIESLSLLASLDAVENKAVRYLVFIVLLPIYHFGCIMD